MNKMFCYQCEQTGNGSGCTIAGVCGKKPETAKLHDELTGRMITLARLSDGRVPSESAGTAVLKGLFTTVTNVNFDDESIRQKISLINDEIIKFTQKNTGRGPVDVYVEYKLTHMWEEDEDVRSLKSLLLFGMRGMAAYAYHAYVLGKSDASVMDFFYKGLSTLGENKTIGELLELNMALGNINLRCMELLDIANTSAYGTPSPVNVSRTIEPGPFIVVSGHDLYELKTLLDQTTDKNINIYTHGEMLPAHGYPELKKHPQLKGHFGTAWQNQQKEFKDLPAPILWTTNCLMPPKDGYADRVYTTSVVRYPGMAHIPSGEDGSKDFSGLIDRAVRLGGYAEDIQFTGANGGTSLTTGYGRQTVLDAAPAIVDAVKAGAIRRFFLVGGCDGAHTSRSYYTEFVKKTPKDTVVLTLACGKFRFNDIDAGSVGPFPRVLDMGQCNDAYGAIQVAVALAGAFGCGVNDLPLTLVLSWYEQKAVCILLTLLSLGIRNIYIGPSLPAFFSPAVLNALVNKFNLTPISTPEADLNKIMG